MNQNKWTAALADQISCSLGTGIRESLTLHSRRRAKLIPTISVLQGPPGLGLRSWNQWVASEVRLTVLSSQPEPAEVVTKWMEALARSVDLSAQAVEFLAGRTSQMPEEVRAGLAAKTLQDFEQLWDSLEISQNGATTVCHWLLQGLVVQRQVNPAELTDQLNNELAHAGKPWLRVVASCGGFLPFPMLPALILFFPGEPVDPMGWIDAATRLLADLVSIQPAMPAALACPAEVLDHYLQQAPETRALALVREGTIPIAGLDEAAVTTKLKDLGVIALPGGTVHRLVADGVDEELVQAFGEVALVLTAPESLEADDRARSRAERFLYELLESRLQTAGQFELNAALDFRFGSAPAEVDLLARDLKLAIEVDGYYHFLDDDAYRRDRRKDWELQRRGFLVLRFLAQDVVAHMEEMLDRILCAVELQSSPFLRMPSP